MTQVQPDKIAPGQLFVVVAVEPAQLVSASLGLKHTWRVPQAQGGNIDRTSKGEGIVHILAVPSFEDRGSTRMLKGLGGTLKGASDSANTPAAVAEVERVVQSCSLEKVAADRVAQVDNIHMDSPRLELPEY